jgi:hypothetical protein
VLQAFYATHSLSEPNAFNTEQRTASGGTSESKLMYDSLKAGWCNLPLGFLQYQNLIFLN